MLSNSEHLIEQIKMWDDSVSPIEEVEKVNIPMLLMHGDVDQRTPPRAARRYMKGLEGSMTKIIKYLA